MLIDQNIDVVAGTNYCEFLSSTDFSGAVYRELRENGLPVDDSDARRAVRKQMADNLLFEKREPLTREDLAAHKALSCIARFPASLLL